MLKNTDTKLSSFRDRIIHLETERRERSEDIKEIYTEMKSRDYSKVEIAGVRLAVKRSFETGATMQARLDAEEIAASLGDMLGTPLADAAIAKAVVA